MKLWTKRMTDYLKEIPQARERKNKNRAVGNVVGKMFGEFYNVKVTEETSLQYFRMDVSKEKLAEFVGMVLDADRAWRRVTEQNESLRGSDYGEKKKLVKQAQKSLGYQSYPPHYNDR